MTQELNKDMEIKKQQEKKEESSKPMNLLEYQPEALLTFGYLREMEVKLKKVFPLVLKRLMVDRFIPPRIEFYTNEYLVCQFDTWSNSIFLVETYPQSSGTSDWFNAEHEKTRFKQVISLPDDNLLFVSFEDKVYSFGEKVEKLFLESETLKDIKRELMGFSQKYTDFLKKTGVIKNISYYSLQKSKKPFILATTFDGNTFVINAHNYAHLGLQKKIPFSKVSSSILLSVSLKCRDLSRRTNPLI